MIINFIIKCFKKTNFYKRKRAKQLAALVGPFKEFKDNVVKTLLNYNWLNSNLNEILSSFPNLYTHTANIDINTIADTLINIGIPINNQFDVTETISILIYFKVLVTNEANPYLIKSNTNLILYKKDFELFIDIN
jgi:hypothetical protein